MRYSFGRLVTITAVLSFGATSACDQAQVAAKPLPVGEDSLSCAALVYATTKFVEETTHGADANIVLNKGQMAITRFGALYGARVTLT